MKERTRTRAIVRWSGRANGCGHKDYCSLDGKPLWYDVIQARTTRHLRPFLLEFLLAVSRSVLAVLIFRVLSCPGTLHPDLSRNGRPETDPSTNWGPIPISGATFCWDKLARGPRRYTRNGANIIWGHEAKKIFST